METSTTQQDLGPVIEQIVENVFQTMMEMEVHRSDAPWPDGGEVITASISLTGAWKGAVMVECSLHDALLFGSRMLGIDPSQEFNEDMRDALGELANMVGGNLKSILPPGVELSLPSVVWGADYTVGICHAGHAQRFVFSGDEATVGVMVVEVSA